MSIPSRALQDSYIVSNYMKQKFPQVLLQVLGDIEQLDDEIPHPASWDVEFALDVDLALDVIARSFHNQGIVSCLLTRIYLIDF